MSAVAGMSVDGHFQPAPGLAALSREQLEAAYTRSLKHQAALALFGARSLSAADLQRLLQEATETVSEATGCEFVKILRHRPETDDFLVCAGIGWKPGVVGHAVLPSGMRSPAGRAFIMGKPVRLSDAEHDESIEWSDLLREHGLVSLVNVPIWSQDTIFGILEIDNPKVRDFSDETIFFLQGFANLIGAAILRMRLELQKDTLFEEFRHRMKNQFQTILAMLALEQGRDEGPIIPRVRNRVLALSLATDQLSQNQAIRIVNIRTYLEELCDHLAESAEGIALHRQIADATLPYESAVSLGLIVNELVTNSMKYAFPGGTGSIEVRLQIEGGSGRLTVADDGVGMSKQPSKSGKGLLLVTGLSQQIQGTVQQEAAQKGTRFSVQFPLKQLEQQRST